MAIQLERVLSSEQLPSLPQVAMEVIRLSRDPEPDFDHLIAVIRTDPAICSRLLRTTNSTLFGLRQNVRSIAAAVPLLGVTLVRTLVLGFSLSSHAHTAQMKRYHQRVWRASLRQAVASELLAERTETADSAEWFLGGLLADVGILALLQAAPDHYGEVVLTDRSWSEIPAEERREFGFDHVQISTELCRRWNLDDNLIDAIGSHHQSRQAGEGTADLALGLVTATHCMEFVDDIDMHRSDDRPGLVELTVNFEIDDAELDAFLCEVDVRVGEIAALFSVDIGEYPPTEKLLLQAHSAMEKIAIRNRIKAIHAQSEVRALKDTLTRMESHQEELQEHAWRDPLTGAYNRNVLQNMLKLVVAKAEDSAQSMGLLFIDLDGFKAINDKWGHRAGDEALISLVRLVTRSILSTDVVVRYGGDEFLVLLAEVDLEQTTAIARRICRRARNIRLESAPEAQFSSSIGGLVYSPDSTSTPGPSRLIEVADEAMYCSKRNGGDRVTLSIMQGETLLPLSAGDADSPPENS